MLEFDRKKKKDNPPETIRVLSSEKKQNKSKSKKKKRTTSSQLVVGILFLAGLCLLIYPSFANWVNSRHSSYAVAQYNHTVQEMDDTEIKQLLQEATEYNQMLYQSRKGTMTDIASVDYSTVIFVEGSKLIGTIEIPSIDVNLPVFRGTSSDVLADGVGHLEGSSLPVGGESTHTVLTGHRGLPTAMLFTRLDELRAGDIFIIKVLNETLTYEVDQIRVVLPKEVDELTITPGEDLATLVTCTPYGVNTHRLLVRGHRISNLAEEVIAQGEANLISPMKISLWIGIPLIVLVVIYLLFFAKPKKDDLSELEDEDFI